MILSDMMMFMEEKSRDSKNFMYNSWGLNLISGSIVNILSILTVSGFISSINISFGDKTIAKTIAN